MRPVVDYIQLIEIEFTCEGIRQYLVYYIPHHFRNSQFKLSISRDPKSIIFDNVNNGKQICHLPTTFRHCPHLRRLH